MKKISIISVINSIKEVIREKINENNSDAKGGPGFWKVELEKDHITAILSLYIDKKLDFERCSENWFRRFCCRLAHGDNSCGCQEFVKIKNFYKEIYGKIGSVLKGLNSYVDKSVSCVYVHGNDLLINRNEVNLRISTGYSFPVSIFSEEFQKIYTKYQNDEVEYEYLEPYLLQEMDYWDEYKGHPRPVSNKN